MAVTYYAQRKSIKGGEPKTPNNRYGTRAEMEKQFHLYCASAAVNDAGNDLDVAEWGTLENGPIERKRWTWTQPEAEAETEQGE